MNADRLTDVEIEACDALWCRVNGDDYHAFMDDIALVVATAKAEAWDEGVTEAYKRGVPNGDMHAHNPYRIGGAS